MSLSRKNITLNFFWSFASFLTGSLRQILLIPVFLSNWGDKLYGFWVLVFSFYAMTIYVIEGYSRYTINEYSKNFFKDQEHAYSFFGSGLKFLLLLSGSAVILFAIILQFSAPVEKVFHVGANVISFYRLRYCLLLMFALACVHSIAKYIGYAILPHGKIYVPERFIAIYVIVETLVWLFASLGYLTLFWWFAIYALVLSVVCIIFVLLVKKKYPFYTQIISGGTLREGWRNAGRSLSLTVNNFCEKFTVDGLNIMVSAFYSAVMVPLYVAKRAIANLMVTATNMIVATFTVEYQRHSVGKNGKALFNLFNATWLLVGFVINYGLIVFYPLLPQIFTAWVKLEVNMTLFNYLLSTSVFIVYGSNIITYLKSINRVKAVFFVAVTRATILLSLIMILPKKLENIGLSLMITEFVVNIIHLNVLLYRELCDLECENVPVKLFWNISPFIITAAYLLTNELFPLEPYLKMTITMVVLTVVYYLQIRRVDNESLLIRLQILKHKIFGGK